MAYDPTAQSGVLTPGQKIVADYESDMIAEPCELAKMIDDECDRRAFRGIVNGVGISVLVWLLLLLLAVLI